MVYLQRFCDRGFRKVNTTAYHPQTDGLVERFNRTLIAMLSKTSKKGGWDWDRRLPYVLFAYRATEQQSTLESPFFLLYGRDPRLPTEAALCPEETGRLVNWREYGNELTERMSTAWKQAKENIKTAQKRQKSLYDRKARPLSSSLVIECFFISQQRNQGRDGN